MSWSPHTSSTTDRAARQSLLLRVKTFIDAHLADPALSAEAIAAAHHVSVRHPQRLFRAENTTVSGWIRGRRLEECHRELGRPRRTRPAVSAVAHRWGFVSPAHFSRAFRATHGMPPCEWQSRADETAGLPPGRLTSAPSGPASAALFGGDALSGPARSASTPQRRLI
ncbi:helix-turn-helix transcriptional regulator [Streptomyces sp. NPDC006430]|uniref:helix-turn-helix transcriptional regulator n=1 Tax=Streptomyces sp. NPDC006430 TaxID=3154299 RepID=UPI0033A9E146